MGTTTSIAEEDRLWLEASCDRCGAPRKDHLHETGHPAGCLCDGESTYCGGCDAGATPRIRRRLSGVATVCA